MDTIATYLDNMFRHLPRTPEVARARAELAQMMEDNYWQLIAHGASENEAVGQVIAQFGDLAEISEAIGLSDATSSVGPVGSGDASGVGVGAPGHAPFGSSNADSVHTGAPGSVTLAAGTPAATPGVASAFDAEEPGAGDTALADTTEALPAGEAQPAHPRPAGQDAHLGDRSTAGEGGNSAHTSWVGTRTTSAINAAAQHRTVRITAEEAEEYLRVHTSAAWRIAVGVGCFIAAPASLILVGWLMHNQDHPFAILALLTFVLVGLAFVIPAGLSLSSFKDWQGAEIVAPLSVIDRAQQELRRARGQLAVLIPAGIGLIFAGVVGVLLIEYQMGKDAPLSPVPVLYCSALGVPFFIIAGMGLARFNRLLNEGDYRPVSIQKSRRQRVWSALAGVYWLLILVTYLVVTIIWPALEDETWLIWPVGAIVFAVIAIIHSVIDSDRA